MRAGVENRVFNRTDRFVEGWYWAIPSTDLRRGQIRPLRLLGRDLVVWRDTSGVAHTHDAYCPHMGAHLAEGRVDGDSLRCFFHHWKFAADGRLTDVPCQDHVPSAAITPWPTEERYGLIWVWAGGPTPRLPVPFVPEMDGQPVRALLGNRFTKGCHPNVVMINAIDEQHFQSVHPLVASLAAGTRFDVQALGEQCVMFNNAEPVPRTNALLRAVGRLYDGPLTYRMVYWNGTTGSVTVGPDAWHFHILFALRPTDDGQTEGQTVLLSPALPGPAGWFLNQIALRATAVVGDYFAKGDTEVFRTIRWRFATPVKADRSVIAFIQHLDRQPVSAWGSWDALERADGAA